MMPFAFQDGFVRPKIRCVAYLLFFVAPLAIANAQPSKKAPDLSQDRKNQASLPDTLQEIVASHECNEAGLIVSARIVGKRIDNKSATELANQLSNLKKLEFFECEFVDDSLPSISGLKLLAELSMIDSKCSMQDFSCLNGTSIHTLSLDRTELSSNQFKQLGQLSLFRLSLAGTAITDEDLFSLGQNSTLLHLNLRDTSVSDVGIKNLGSMPSLLQLNLAGTQVTSHSESLLRKAMPSAFSYVPSNANQERLETEPFMDIELYRGYFPPMRATFSWDGRWLVVAGMTPPSPLNEASGEVVHRPSGRIDLFDTESGQKTILRENIRAQSDPTVYNVAFSPNGKWLASEGENKDIELWDCSSVPFQKRKVLHCSDSFVLDSLQFTFDNQNLVAISSTGTEVFRLSDFKEILVSKDVAEILKTLYPPDCQHIIQPTRNMDFANTGDVVVLSSDRQRVLASFLVADKELIAITRDQKLFAGRVKKGTAQFLRATSRQPTQPNIADRGQELSSQMIALWQIEAGVPNLWFQIDAGVSFISCLSISEDRKFFATIGERLRVWRLK